MIVKPTLLLAATVAIVAPLIMGATPIRSYRLASLGPANTLVVFSAGASENTRSIAITGIEGNAVGIDVRPANGKLYAITNRDSIYAIDPRSGSATYVSKLSSPFGGSRATGMDFNPQTDRLRLVGPEGQNLRMNVDLGAVAIDANLSYVAGDDHNGNRPHTSAVGYTRSVPKARSTTMYSLDTSFDTLVRQDPPNDGILTTVGPLGVDCSETAGFDIVPDSRGVEHAFALCNKQLYSIDLGTGAARLLATITAAEPELLGLAILADER
jgi:hypothetical protein